MSVEKGYDIRCYDLAIVFLEDRFDRVPVRIAQKLAQRIQNSIEDFLEWELGKKIGKVS